MHECQPLGVICLTVDLLLTSAVHSSSISIERPEETDPTTSPHFLRVTRADFHRYASGIQLNRLHSFHLLKGGVVRENYRSQLANQFHIDAQGKKKKRERKKGLYIKRHFISLRCRLAGKRKTVDVIPTLHGTKFGLKAMLCPHLTCIVPEGARGKMLKQTTGC